MCSTGASIVRYSGDFEFFLPTGMTHCILIGVNLAWRSGLLPLGVTLFEFHHILLLLYGVVCLILGLAIIVEHLLVTDTHRHIHTDTGLKHILH